MKIPIVTGTGERFELDSDDYPRIVLAEVCDETDPRLWELFVEEPVSSADSSSRRAPHSQHTGP